MGSNTRSNPEKDTIKGFKMDDILSELDDEQRQVVLHRKGPAIVIAGPGSGKTKTITTRAAALIREGVPPEAIMMITFTRAAAQGMVKRAAGIDSRAAYMTAGTFHAVGSKIVQANHKIFGIDKEFTILDSDDTEQLVKKHLENEKKDGKNWPRASTISKIISYSINTGIGIEASINQRAPDYIHLASEITRIAEKHAIYKLENGLLSYDDILVMWAALLEDDEIGPELRKRWQYIMLDEQQDANWLQQQVVKGLTGPNGNVMAVGDPGQAIYGFRGSSPGVMKELYDLYPDAQVYTISSNYRSTREIVTLSSAIDKMLNIGFNRNLKSGTGRTGSVPVIVNVQDAASEAEVIADAILKDKENGGELSDHAILVRSTSSSRRIEAEFISRNIPFTVMGGTRLDEAAHIRDILSVARLTLNFMLEPAWFRLLTKFPRIGTKAADEVTQKIMKCEDLHEVCSILEKEGAVRKTGLSTLAEALRSGSKDNGPSEKLTDIINELNPVLSEHYKDDWKTRSKDLDAIIMIAQEYPNLADFLTAITLDGSIDKENVGSVEKPEEFPVTISTIHGAKGLEYKHVHIPSFVQGGMPSIYANGDEEREEEKRIFFVAVTRAKDTLTFYSPRFTTKTGALTSISEYHPVIEPFVDSSNTVFEKQSGNARIESNKKIDFRSKILANIRK
jgi:DNA helicase-2/ATP-dependent DNA helicase PcrA